MVKPTIKLRGTIQVNRQSEAPLIDALTSLTDELRSEIRMKFPGWTQPWEADTWERFQKQPKSFFEALRPYVAFPLKTHKPAIQAGNHLIPLDAQNFNFKLTNFTYNTNENDTLELYYDSPALAWLETIGEKMLLAYTLKDGENTYKPFFYTLEPDVSIIEYHL